MGYGIIEGTNKIYCFCLKNELYLEQGLMLEAIYEQRTGPFHCKAITYNDEAIAVLIPDDHEGRFVYSGMLYIRPGFRKSGIGRELVKRSLSLAGDREVFWNPWDRVSTLFFQRLINEGILTENHFTPYRLKIMELGMKFVVATSH